MIKALLKVQFASLFATVFRTDSGKKRGLGFKIFMGILAVYVVGVLLFVLGFMFFGILGILESLGDLMWLYWAMAAMLCLVMSFIFTIFMANSTLFEAKDNELLMSMPIKPRHILFTRMFSLYIVELLFTLLVMLPAAAVYIIFASANPLGLIFIILGTFLLPMLALALATVVGWLIGLISSRMRHKNLITAVLMAAFFIGFMVVYMNIYNYIMELAASGMQIAEVFRKALPFAYHFGLAVDGPNVLYFLLFILWCVIPAAIVYFVISKNFVKIATTNRGQKKTKYVERPMKVSGVRAALLKKEFSLFTSIPLYMFNQSIGLVLMLLYSGAMLIKGRDLIAMLMTDAASDFGVTIDPATLSGFLILFVALILLFCIIMNQPSSVALSLEGDNIWILRSSPIRFSDVLFAKAGLTIAIGLPFIVISVVATALAIPMTALQIVGLLLLLTSVQTFIAIFGFMVNLWFPKFNFNSPSQVIKQSASSVISIFAAMAFLAIPVILYIVAFATVNPTGYLYYVSFCFIVLTGLMLLYLNLGGKKIYDSINA